MIDTYHSLYQSNLARQAEAGQRTRHPVFQRLRQRLHLCIQSYNSVKEEGDTISGFNGPQ